MLGLAVLAAAWVVSDLVAGDGLPAPTAVRSVGTATPEPDVDPPPVPPTAVPATVDHVHDGDTLTLVHADGRVARSRLLRIDAPELARDGQPAQCGAQEARAQLAAMAPAGTEVLVAWDVERQDRYGRDLVHLWLDDQTWVNGQMVAHGWATVVTFRPNVAHTAGLVTLQESARAEHLGVWGRC